ncbi:MAG: hypothetical protein JO001_20475 [Alphaproteobacteria bacterium]|nr:hypothetical protein [Alphaproteobacteria bacterium]
MSSGIPQPQSGVRLSRRHVLSGLAGATVCAAAAGFSLLRSSVTDASVTGASVKPQADATDTAPIDGRRTLVVTARDSTTVALIAFDDDRLIGHLDLGIVPRELRVSDGGLLAAADGNSRQVAFVDVATQTVRHADLPVRPTRLVASPDGATLAAIDADSGEIAVIEFRSGRLTLRLQGPAHVRAAIFSTDAALLFIGADTLQGVAVFDLVSGRLTGTIAGRLLSTSCAHRTAARASRSPPTVSIRSCIWI